MAFIAGAVVIGGVYAVGHDRYSDNYYSDYHSRHSNYREYGDSALVSAIENKKNEIDAKEQEVDRLQEQMEENFKARLDKLKAERNYSSFGYSDDETIIDNIKEEMIEEIDSEISQEKQELAAIDKMIARINEIELQAKRE